MATAKAKAEPDIVTLAAETLAGDLRDFLLDRLRHDHNPLPWNMRPEADQKEAVDRTTAAVRAWVHKACVLIAADGQKAARGSLVKFQAKDGIQMQVNVAASDPLRHALMDHIGAPVLIVLADPAQYGGEHSEVPISKDQADMLDEPQE